MIDSSRIWPIAFARAIVGSGCLTDSPSTIAKGGDGAKFALEIPREVATTSLTRS